MRILHISDVHFSAKIAPDVRLVTTSLLSRVADYQRVTPFDLVVFSGDIVAGGEEFSDYEGVRDAVIKPIMAALNLPASKFILCPGNHDLSGKAFSKAAMIDRTLASELSTFESVNKFLDQEVSFLELSLKPLEHYEIFEADHYGDPPNMPTRLLRVFNLRLDNTKAGVCVFNSAWRSQAGTGKDDRRLLIGERTIDAALTATEECEIRIAVMHHPLDWLTEFDRGVIEPRLFQQFDLLLFGHMHSWLPEQTSSPFGGIVKVQSGCLFQRRGFMCSFNVIDLDRSSETVTISIEEWSEPQRIFQPCLKLAPVTGSIVLPLVKPALDQTKRKIEGLLNLARQHIRSLANNHATLLRTRNEPGDDIKQVFVCPPLKLGKRSGADPDPKDAESKGVSIEKLLTQSDNLIIFGGREAGKTTLGHLIAVYASEGRSDTLRIPALLDGRKLKPYENGLLNAIKAYLSPSEPDYPRLDKLEAALPQVRELPCLVIVDNVSIHDKSMAETIQELMALRPQDRWILLTEGDGMFGDTFKSDHPFHNIQAVHFAPLPRRTIREISRRRNELGEDETAELFPVVMEQLSNAGLPRNGYVISLLSWMNAQNIKGEPLNEAVLIRNLVEHLLDRGGFKDAIRGTFDPEVKEILLSELSHFMRGKLGLPLNEALLFVGEYFQRKQWTTYEADKVLRSLLDCRILEISDGLVHFRFACFQEYFVARYINDNPDFLQELKNENRLADYARELDLMTSLNRRDAGLVELIQGRFEILEAEGDNSGHHYEIAGAKLATEIYAPRLLELRKRKLTQPQVDDLLDEVEGRATNHPSQRVQDQNAEGDTDKADNDDRIIRKEYALLISLFGRVIRNAEALDGEAKMKAISSYLDRTTKIVGNMIFKVGDEVPDFKEFSERTGIALTKEEISAVVAFIQTMIPTASMELMYRDIGSRKLLGAFEALLAEDSLPLDKRLALIVLMSKLDTERGARALSDNLEKFEGKRLGLNVLHYVHSSMYYLHEYSPGADNDIEGAIADLEIKLNKGGNRGITLQSLRLRRTQADVKERSRGSDDD